jgi:hypothetical protein
VAALSSTAEPTVASPAIHPNARFLSTFPPQLDFPLGRA